MPAIWTGASGRIGDVDASVVPKFSTATACR